MVKKIALITLFLIAGCGKDVKISGKELEYNSGLSSGNTLTTNQEGVISRNNPDILTVNGTVYKVSIYSSYKALEFIAARPLNTQYAVKFRGKIKNKEMVLEVVELK